MQRKFLSLFTGKKPDVELHDFSKLKKKRRMYIGCSGGQGHNSAIRGIIYEDQSKHSIEVPSYDAKLYSTKSNSKRDQLEQGFRIQYDRIFGEFIREIVEKTPLPVLPLHEKIKKEVENLNRQSMDKEGNPIKRPYIDMLLDVYDIGYESAAIWNVLQREDNAAELKKLIKLQKLSDSQNHDHVKKYFLEKLVEAYKKDEPYYKIVSTQAMALPALCDAVLKYNEKYSPKITIKQYFTDLVTPGAVHFLDVLTGLNKRQRSVMELHGVSLGKFIQEPKNIEKHNLIKPPFAKIKDIPPENNPMVRPGFKKTYLSQFTDHLPYTEDNQLQQISVKPTDIVASIMLGSQAGADTIKYIEKLRTTADIIFVFGGKNFIQEVQDLEAKSTEDLEFVDLHMENKNRIFDEQAINKHAKIVLLGNQNDDTIAPIMARSNLIVIRSGGLSAMEQMALHAFFNGDMRKIIFIHHKDSPNWKLTSGIIWEDENGNELIIYLSLKGVHVIKTSPEKILEDIKIDTNGLNRLLNFINSLEPFIKKTPPSPFNFKPSPKDMAVKKLHGILNKYLLIILTNKRCSEVPLLNDDEIKSITADEQLTATIQKYMNMTNKEDVWQINTSLTMHFSTIKSLNREECINNNNPLLGSINADIPDSTTPDRNMLTK